MPMLKFEDSHLIQVHPAAFQVGRDPGQDHLTAHMQGFVFFSPFIILHSKTGTFLGLSCSYFSNFSQIST